MANYTLDSIKAMAAKERIDRSARQINDLLQKYTQAKRQLLSTWEGSMKDLFVQETGQNLETNCQTLINGLNQLASDIGITSDRIKTSHIKGANIIKNR